MSGKLQKIEFFYDYQMGDSLNILEKMLKENSWIYRIVCHLCEDDIMPGQEPEFYTMSDRGSPTLTYTKAFELFGFPKFNELYPSVVALMKAKGWSEKKWKVIFALQRDGMGNFYYSYEWNGCRIARIGDDIHTYNPNANIPTSSLKRPLEVVPYTEAVKKVKVATEVVLETVMKPNKSVADIVKELSTKLENDDDLRKAIEKVNDTKASKNYRTGYSFAKSSADCSFYFLWLMLKAGYPASYEFNTLGKFRVAVAVGKEEESILSGMTQRDPGFYEESIGGVAYCNGQPRPPLRRVYENDLSLFFPSDIKESTRDEYLGYIRDFIVFHFPKSS